MLLRSLLQSKVPHTYFLWEQPLLETRLYRIDAPVIVTPDAFQAADIQILQLRQGARDSRPYFYPARNRDCYQRDPECQGGPAPPFPCLHNTFTLTHGAAWYKKYISISHPGGTCATTYPLGI